MDGFDPTTWWAPFLAFAAGIVAFASPCVLPIVPGYLSFVTAAGGRPGSTHPGALNAGALRDLVAEHLGVVA